MFTYDDLQKDKGNRYGGFDGGVASLDAMKEDHTTNQQKMKNEDWDNKKLKPILEEAYYLVEKIENKKTEADKKVNQLKDAKAKLMNKYNELKKLEE